MNISSFNKKLFSLCFIVLFVFSISSAQNAYKDSIHQAGDYRVTLDTSHAVNANHIYINYFKEKDHEYILGLYTTNKSNMKDYAHLMGPAKLVKGSGGNNSLVFTVYEEGKIRLDTLRNSIHPYTIGDNEEKYCGFKKVIGKVRAQFAKNNLSVKSLEGKLPKGSMTWLSKQKRKKMIEFGILVPDTEGQVNITIKNKSGKIISTVVDERLPKGWNNFEWSRGYFPKGKYKITYTLNGHSMSQQFKV